jgi:hypothetical protein
VKFAGRLIRLVSTQSVLLWFSQFQHPTPPLEQQCYDGISFSKTPHLLPWALRTIAPGSLNTNRPVGHLTEDGEKRVKKAFLRLFSL